MLVFVNKYCIFYRNKSLYGDTCFELIWPCHPVNIGTRFNLICIQLNRFKYFFPHFFQPHDGVMFSMLASSAVDRGFEPQSVQTRDYNLGICCFSSKNTALRRKGKNWLAQNEDNVSEWGDMSICGLLFQWASTIKIQLHM